MTVPVLNQEQFISFLKDNGCDVVSTEFWNDHDTIVMIKDGQTFTLTLEQKYFYYTVCLKCISLNILPPEDHLYSFKQHFNNRECFCQNGKKFNDCCLKQIEALEEAKK